MTKAEPKVTEKSTDVEKLLQMRQWIDEHFPKYYRPYEQGFIRKAKDVGLNPYTIKALKREFEIRFNISNVEWNMLHILLHFSAMRQAGVSSRMMNNKKIEIDVKGLMKEDERCIQQMILLMWDVIERKDKKNI